MTARITISSILILAFIAPALDPRDARASEGFGSAAATELAVAIGLIEPIFPDLRYQWVSDHRDRNGNGVEDGDERDPNFVFSWPVHLWLPVDGFIDSLNFIHPTLFIEPQYLLPDHDARLVFGGRIVLGSRKTRANIPLPVLIAEGGAVCDRGEVYRMIGGGIGFGGTIMYTGLVLRRYDLGMDTYDISLDFYWNYNVFLWSSTFRDYRERRR